MLCKWLAALIAMVAVAGQPLGAAGKSPVERGVGEGQRQRAVAVFAGGCFWCMEPPFDKVEGVVSTTAGYAGGHIPNPTYEQVSSGSTEYRESVKVVYDPTRTSYEKLLDVYWHNVDPLDAGGQFCDRGHSYTTAIFAQNAEQERLATASRMDIQSMLKQPVATTVVLDTNFYPAEPYHQDFYRKNPVRYHFYRWQCGRDARLAELWGH